MPTEIQVTQNTTQVVTSARPTEIANGGERVTMIIKDGGGRGPAGDPGIYVGDTPPDDPAENQLWLDTSQ